MSLRVTDTEGAASFAEKVEAQYLTRCRQLTRSELTSLS